MRRTYEALATKVYRELKVQARVRRLLDLDTGMSTGEVCRSCGYSSKYRRVFDVLFDLQERGFVRAKPEKYQGVSGVKWRWYLVEDYPDE